ncbi:MAG TPA: M2 family metallopeptidase [Polyangia bacterium]|nr:M2 family metallopeptidase [Polyangia bacterium]
MTTFALAVLGSSVWLSTSAAQQAEKPKTPAVDPAKRFIDKTNEDLRRLIVKAGTADWVKNTYITDDTELLAASANDELLGYTSQAIKQATKFKNARTDADTKRMLTLLRVSSSLAGPSDPKLRLELTSLGAKMEALYGKAKACGKDGTNPKCLDIEALNGLFGKSRNEAELRDGWLGWHRAARDMRPLYARFVELANQGARDIGFADTGEMWRSAYDMTPAAFEQETERLWQQVRPLYEQLHCYVRSQLVKTYGKDKVPVDGPMPAHLLGNMWAQEWFNVAPLVEPYKGQPALDVSPALAAQKWDATKMLKTGERFFTSLGLDPLPPSFWERSMLTKPRDREVVCHASASDVGMNNDLRVKMCIKPTEEDLITIHHELGHDYYFHAYYQLPALYQNGANDGFHEALGDALALSVTPQYLKDLGLLTAIPKDDQGLINVQMKEALAKVAFLPFGLLIDKWRWDVFAGKTTPADYNKAWWALRRKYQGIDAPEARTEDDFDPGAKYHIPANVPYTRYFLARLLQFQFHRALCRAAGQTGPLHACSIYGSKEAGKALATMMALGASKPWPEALKALTGETRMDASALLEYFTPLSNWLKEKNAGQKCGW